MAKAEGHRIPRYGARSSRPVLQRVQGYGRLRERNLDGKVAVRCYGYTTLPPTIESQLEEDYEVIDWDRTDYGQPVKKRAHFRAIVKDLIREDVPLTAKTVNKIRRDLRKIRKQGIFPGDIKPSNYRGGLLVDFSTAMTTPNYLFQIKPKWHVRSLQNEDLFQFDTMVEEEGIKTNTRGAPNQEYLRKLRRHRHINERYGFSPPVQVQLVKGKAQLV